MDGPCLNNQIDLCYGPCDGQITESEYKEHIKKIDLFFQGKYTKIIKDLEAEMKEAAKEFNFEKAAVLRDQIQSIEGVMEKQFVEFENETNQDIIATSLSKDNAIMIILRIRNGKIIGKDDYIMTNRPSTESVEEDNIMTSSSDEIISAFIKQYYGINRQIPKEILLEEEIPDKSLIEEWLSDIRGNKVSIKVPQKGTKLRLVRMASKNAEIIKKQKQKMENSMMELKRYLKLEKLPRVIEGYDISNISGKLAVGSKVSFLNGKPNKKQYKKFKMKTPGPNDFAMMKELLERRFRPLAEYYSNEERGELKIGEEPDLILIDGGKGQLKMAVDVLGKYNLRHIPVIGLAKEFEEIYIPGSSYPIRIPHSNEGLQLLQQVRDESHRFAITFHRQLRAKKIEESELDNIDGVGKKRKINLLKEFGDIEGIRVASLEEIMGVESMNEKVAKNVYNHFHNKEKEEN